MRSPLTSAPFGPGPWRWAYRTRFTTERRDGRSEMFAVRAPRRLSAPLQMRRIDDGRDAGAPVLRQEESKTREHHAAFLCLSPRSTRPAFRQARTAVGSGRPTFRSGKPAAQSGIVQREPKRRLREPRRARQRCRNFPRRIGRALTPRPTVLRHARGPQARVGRPLPTAVRAEMESRTGDPRTHVGRPLPTAVRAETKSATGEPRTLG